LGILVIAVKDAYLQELKKAGALRRARLGLLEQLTREVRKELDRCRQDSGPSPPWPGPERQRKALQAYDLARREADRLELDLLRAQLDLEAKIKAKSAPPPAVPAPLVAAEVDRDPEIQKLLRQLGQVCSAIADIEDVAVHPEELQEYRAYTFRKKSLQEGIDRRRTALRSQAEKRLREVTHAGPAERAVRLAREEVERLKARHQELSARADKQFQALIGRGGGGEGAGPAAWRPQDIERLTKISRQLQAAACPEGLEEEADAGSLFGRRVPLGSRARAGGEDCPDEVAHVREAERLELCDLVRRHFQAVTDPDGPGWGELDAADARRLVADRLVTLGSLVSDRAAALRAELQALPHISLAPETAAVECLSPPPALARARAAGLAGLGGFVLALAGVGWRQARLRQRSVPPEVFHTPCLVEELPDGLVGSAGRAEPLAQAPPDEADLGEPLLLVGKVSYPDADLGETPADLAPEDNLEREPFPGQAPDPAPGEVPWGETPAAGPPEDGLFRQILEQNAQLRDLFGEPEDDV
jgi:hypothetical protein